MDGYFQPLTSLTDSRRPIYAQHEIELAIIDHVTLHTGDDQQGRECCAFLSTHRLIFEQGGAAFFLHLHLVQRAEQQGGWLSSAKLLIHLNPRPITLPTSSDFLTYQSALLHSSSSSTPPPPPGYLRLHLRSDALTLLLTHLTHALTARIWTSAPPPPSTTNTSSFTPTPSTSLPPRDFSTSSAGVSGLIRDVDATTRHTDRTLDAAFTDLTALMRHAGSVVALAEKLSRTLQASPASSEEEAALTSLLTSIGLPNPIMRHSTPPSSFHTSLAQQLSDFISSHPRFLTHHMLTLTEVFCLYNRARGTDLISPADCLKACELIRGGDGGSGGGGGKGGLGVVELRSGVRVVCRAGMVERGVEEVRRVVGEAKGITSLEAGTLLGLSVLLVEERCSIAEGRGWIVRDESIEGCRWWLNLFEQWQPMRIQT